MNFAKILEIFELETHKPSNIERIKYLNKGQMKIEIFL